MKREEFKNYDNSCDCGKGLEYCDGDCYKGDHWRKQVTDFLEGKDRERARNKMVGIVTVLVVIALILYSHC